MFATAVTKMARIFFVSIVIATDRNKDVRLQPARGEGSWVD